MSEMKTLWGFPPASVGCVECAFVGTIPELSDHCKETGHGQLRTGGKLAAARAAAPSSVPFSAGMTEERTAELRRVLARGIEQGGSIEVYANECADILAVFDLGAALLTAVKEAQTAGGYWLDIAAGDAYLRVWGAQKDTDATRALAAALRASLSRQSQEGRDP